MRRLSRHHALVERLRPFGLLTAGLAMTVALTFGMVRLGMMVDEELRIVMRDDVRASPPSRPPLALPNAARAAAVTAAAARARAAAADIAVPGVEDATKELQSRRLTIPVSGVVRDRLISSFEEERDGRRHEAMDILAARGTPVIAVEDGTIAKLFWSRYGGHTIYQFDPSGRYAYYYAHLDRYADGLVAGGHVTRGRVIGYVGTSGNADPGTPHLHFAVFRLGPERRWWQGDPIDPYAVFRDARTER